MRFITANENVSVVIPGMAEEREIDQNIAAVEDTSALSAEELAKIQQIRSTLGTQFCRRCNYCAPCAVGINIPMVLLVEGYLSRYGLSDWAAQRYAGMEKKASDCIQCGLCESRCPYQLPIRQLLKNAAEKLEK
jgi:predicted aldo/keto reductase-like oxidoreductase